MTDILSELIDKTPPTILYHYTTQVGLIGIIRGDEIWATHTQYLNDDREYIHALELVKAEIARLLDAAPGVAEKRALDEMLAAVSGKPQSINVCVCSFSENGDSLAQWSEYGESMSGFSIGFHSKFLSDRAAQERFNLAPCVYEMEDQVTLVRRLVAKVLSEILEHDYIQETDENFFHWRHGGNLGVYLHRVAPALKDKAFREEKEWRIISRPLMSTGERFGYRPGKSKITPYYRIPLMNDPDRVGEPRISRIVVGPTPDSELSKQSVRSLLSSVHLQNTFTPGGPVQVDASTVPYRSW